jgi:hypothetical protein
MQIHDDVELLSKAARHYLKMMAEAPGAGDPPKLRQAHEKKMEAWSKENVPGLIEAGVRVFGQFFIDINSIANGVNK